MEEPLLQEIRAALAEPVPGIRRAITADLRQRHFPDDPEGWRETVTRALAPYGPVILAKLAECGWDLGKLDPCAIWCPSD